MSKPFDAKDAENSDLISAENAEFKDAIAKALAEDKDLDRELACEFGCAVSTVYRWADGVANPHPRIQKNILDYLANREAGYSNWQIARIIEEANKQTDLHHITLDPDKGKSKCPCSLCRCGNRNGNGNDSLG